MKIKQFLFGVIFSFLIFPNFGNSQLNISLEVIDGVTNRPISDATTILISPKNRKMLGFSRSNGLGMIKLNIDSMPDTAVVWVLHKKYIDYNGYVYANSITPKFQLLPQSRVIKEVLITTNKAVTMSGDTVSYIADSFKLPPGSSVEELLKNLPGLQVAKDGTIKAQGKKVERVLVDGDDFFGEDASVATRNLEASMINKVEVINVDTKKSEISGSDDDKMKIINLKLKDEAKQGFFGKIEGGYANTERYKNTNMINVFNGNTKAAAFLTVDNMQSRMDWRDMQDLGINQNWTYDEDLDTYTDNGGFNTSGNTNNVIPDNLKTGTHITQKFGDGSGAIKAKYNYTQSQYDGFQTFNSTSYFNEFDRRTLNENYVNSKLKKHSGGIMIEKRLDSIHKIVINSSVNFGNFNGYNQVQNQIFLDSTLVNRASKTNPFDNKTVSGDIDLDYETKFQKKGRHFGAKIEYNAQDKSGTTFNQLNGYTYKSSSDSTIQSIDQMTDRQVKTNTLKYSMTYVEPIIKNFSLEAGFAYLKLDNESLLNTFNKDSLLPEYTEKISSLSNNYLYKVNAYSERFKILYKNKKWDLGLGFKLHQVAMNQKNLDNQFRNIERSYQYWLPNASVSWKYKRNSQMILSFNKSITPPSLDDLQPFINNSNPQYILQGNPNLIPTERYVYRLNNNLWYPISQTNLWASFSYRTVNHAVVDSSVIDEQGISRSFKTQVDGNRGLNFNVWYGFVIKKLDIQVNPGFWFDVNQGNQYYNSQKVKTNTLNSSFSLGFEKKVDSLFDFGLNTSIDWNQVSSENPNFKSTNNIKWEINPELKIDLPWRFKWTTELNISIYQQNESFSQSPNIYLLNMHLERGFLKENALSIKLTAFDILKQNQAFQRNFWENQVNETVSQRLTQYVMLTMTYKFKNKPKGKTDESAF